jgi:hypothetical protein
MHRHRDSSSTIWRTVVFAGAMLGVPACGGSPKPAPATPQNAAGPEAAPAPTPTTQTEPAKPDTTPAADPCAGQPMPQQATKTEDPPADPQPATPPKKRPRGGGDRPVGRGFVLA